MESMGWSLVLVKMGDWQWQLKPATLWAISKQAPLCSIANAIQPNWQLLCYLFLDCSSAEDANVLVFMTWASEKQDEATMVISIWDARQGLNSGIQGEMIVQWPAWKGKLL